MFLSSVGVTAALIGKARASAHHEDDWSLNWLSVSFVLCFVIAFELGPGPIPWQIGAEIFPEHARAAAMSAAAALNWVCNAAVGLGFPAMSSALGSLVFLPFAAVLLLWLLFTARFTPETRGRSVDEIQVEFRRLAALGSRKPARAEGGGGPLSSIRQPQG